MIKKDTLFFGCIIFIIISLVVYFAFGSSVNSISIKENIISSLLCGFVISIILMILKSKGIIKFKTKEQKEKEKNYKKLLLESINNLTSDEIRKRIEEGREFENNGLNIIKKRKDFNIEEIINKELSYILFSGAVIFFLSFFYFGALPELFNVNNEFINPSNSSMGLNYSFNIVGNSMSNLINGTIMEEGRNHPHIWFWLWWLSILTYFVVLIIKIIYHLFKKCLLKGGKKQNGI